MTTAQSLTWTNTREVAFALLEAHPGVDPLGLPFTELHAMVLKLPGFMGKAAESNEKVLEAIQMTWLDEVE